MLGLFVQHHLEAAPHDTILVGQTPGVREYRETPGNLGVLVLRRPQEDLVEVTTVSFWTSMDAIKAFAGDNPEQAKFYPGDDALLAEKDTHAQHYEVVNSDLDPSIGDAS